MNPQLNTFLTALAAVAAAVVLALALAEAADTQQPQALQAIVKLGRVVVVGKAVPATHSDAVAQRIETLPRVVVEGRRADVAIQVAMAQQACTAQASC